MAACPRSKKTRPCPPIRSLLAEAAAAIRSPAARPSMAMPDAMRSSRSAAAWAACAHGGGWGGVGFVAKGARRGSVGGR
eukprot:scaffold8787_cov56-Isochrysis_galbana.AAC.1